MIFLVGAILLGMTVVGIALLYWAKPLSIRYDAWNIRVMTVILQVFGVALVLISVRSLAVIIRAAMRH